MNETETTVDVKLCASCDHDRDEHRFGLFVDRIFRDMCYVAECRCLDYKEEGESL